MNHVSLFSGYGGLDLGLKMAIPDLRTVLYCEYDRYAQGVLISRMRDGGLDPAPIWTDVRTLDGKCWRGCVDIISGGFPCQDVSVAGKRAGVVEGNRSGLWFEYARLIGEIRPRFAFIENVAGLVSNGFDRVLCDLTAMGYDTEWGVISAAEAGAIVQSENEHVFVLAQDNSTRGQGLVTSQDIGKVGQREWGCEENLQLIAENATQQGDCWPQPLLRRMDAGRSFRVERLRCIGNSFYPQQAALAFQILSERITA